MSKFWLIVLIAGLAALAGLAGCQSAAPTSPDSPEGYPVMEDTAYAAPAADEAQEPAPGQAPARPNRSRVTAELIEAAPDEANPSLTRLRVKLLASQAVEGMASMTDDLVEQEIDLLVETDTLPVLQPGQRFTAEVAWMGDENGANFYGQDIAGQD